VEQSNQSAVVLTVPEDVSNAHRIDPLIIGKLSNTNIITMISSIIAAKPMTKKLVFFCIDQLISVEVHLYSG
jgi:hypothetical protein